MLISDKEWAHGLCGNSALYVDRDDLYQVCLSIKKILNNTYLINSITQNGVNKLLEYPSIKEKTKSELNFINKVFNN